MSRRAADRIVDRVRAASVAEAWRQTGERVVVCRGIFDLLAVGHVRRLAEARRSGDRMVVLIHDDAEAARLGGAGRPVLAARDRAALVAALRGVDLVTVVEEPAMDEWVRGWGPAIDVGGAESRAGAPASPVTESGPDPGLEAHTSAALVARVRQRYRGRP